MATRIFFLIDKSLPHKILVGMNSITNIIPGHKYVGDESVQMPMQKRVVPIYSIFIIMYCISGSQPFLCEYTIALNSRSGLHRRKGKLV